MISIIIPVYNVKTYLDQCISSVVAQNYSNFECMIVDDGSNDGSQDICDKWENKDNRIKVIHQKNSGVSAARNKGIELAKGEYITFIDSDDFIEDSYLFDLVSEIDKESDLIISGYKLYPQKEHLKYSYKKCRIKIDADYTTDFIEINKLSLIYGPCGKLYKKDIINKYNIRFNPNLSLGEDLFFNYEYLSHINNLVNIPNINYNYRIENSESLSKKVRKDLFDLCYKEWLTLKEFYIKKNMWNPISQTYLYRLLWGFIYDSIFQYPLLSQKKYEYLYNILSIPEISDLKSFFSVYPCAKWIKQAIIYRQAWIFYLYFKFK